MSFFTTTQTDLLAILAADGEALTFNTRAGGPDVTFTTVMHRNGEDGSATVNIPTASVAAPVFADKITDASAAIWYISDARETLQGRTYCDLKLSTWWQTVDIEEFAGGSWGTHTASVICIIDANSSFEDFDEFNSLTTEFTVRMQYMSDPTQKMRLKWGSRYLYITGIRPDETETRFMDLDCREDEA